MVAVLVSSPRPVLYIYTLQLLYLISIIAVSEVCTEV